MMFEMDEVVTDKRRERYRGVRADLARRISPRFGDLRDEIGEVPVIGVPEGDEIGR